MNMAEPWRWDSNFGQGRSKQDRSMDGIAVGGVAAHPLSQKNH